MPALPARVRERLVAGIKRYQPVFTSAKARDVAVQAFTAASRVYVLAGA